MSIIKMSRGAGSAFGGKVKIKTKKAVKAKIKIRVINKN